MYRLRLVNNDGTDSLDLLNGPLRVMNWGWNTTPAKLTQNVRKLPQGVQANSLGFEPQVESLNLAQFDCDDAIRAAIKKLEVFFANAAAYMDDPVNNDSQWIEWVTQGEGIKRSLLTGGSWVPTSRQGSWPLLGTGNIIANAVLNRHPLWENSVESNDTEATISSVGGMWAFTNTAGRAPARIARADFHSQQYADPLKTVWAGFRPKHKGLTSFIPVWECEDAVGGGPATLTNNTATADDADASNGHVAVTTFANTNMQKRVRIRVYDVLGSTTVNAKHFAGRYLVLCRCWIAAATKSATIQMRQGYQQSPSAGELIVVNNIAPMYKELGEIQIPPLGLWNPDTAGYDTLDNECAYFTIELWAQNIDATTLTMDCLVLIPSDYFLKIENADLYWTINPTITESHTTVRRLENERLVCYTYTDDGGSVIGIDESASASGKQWYLPVGDSVMVVAAQEAALQYVSDNLWIRLNWYPRWQSYRD